MFATPTPTDLSTASGRIVNVIDYLVVIDDGRSRDDEKPAGTDGPHDLGHGVAAEHLDQDLADRLLRACEKRGENLDGTLLYKAAYAYTRTATPEEFMPSLYGGWDPTETLFDTLWLSRLVYDNATTTEFAVRRIFRRDGGERLVPFDGYDSHVAYKIDAALPDWLTDAEVSEAASLLNSLRMSPPSERVARALRYSELATRERYLEEAQPLIIRGLEALLKVGRQRLQRQFSQRTCQLAAELGVEVGENRCWQAYDDRSALVHGAHVDLSQPVSRDAFTDTMSSLQQVLRRAGRRALEDPEFAAIFAADDSIVDHWPATYCETF
jgi:hypothetical protein